MESTKRARPWLAGLLSFFLPTVGLFYAGFSLGIAVLIDAATRLMPALSYLLTKGMSAKISFVAAFGLSLFVAILITVIACIRAKRLPRASAEAGFGKYALAFVMFAIITAVAYVADSPFEHGENFHVPTSSMEPTIKPGDRVRATPESYKDTMLPDRGDIIVFISPMDQSTKYVKRVIGLPGDKISITNGQVSVNGIELIQNPTDDPEILVESNGKKSYKVRHSQPMPSQSLKFPKEGDYVVGQGEVFVLGDNRNDAMDSRMIPHILLSAIVGRVEFVLFNPGNRHRIFLDL